MKPSKTAMHGRLEDLRLQAQVNRRRIKTYHGNSAWWKTNSNNKK